jgi:hypothetical protein
VKHTHINPEHSMDIFSGTRDAFQMLKRLVRNGQLRNFNDVIAGELIAGGYAMASEEDLLVTDKGREAFRSLAMPPPR